MTETDNHNKNIEKILDGLIQNWENEAVEFKQASCNYSTEKVGQYLSALANEVSLRGLLRAWLVFGVHNKTRAIVGSNFRQEPKHLESIKVQMAQATEPPITFREIYVFNRPEGRVVMFEVPPAPSGVPVSWQGHYYARAGESLVSLGLDKLDEIRRQTISPDWSAQTLPSAKIEHIDENALHLARESFARKHANRIPADDVMKWSISVFWDKAQLTQDGSITRTALLLLGKPEASHLISPHPAQMTWKLADYGQAYEHFGPPFFLNTTELYRKIRNVQLRILPEDALMPVEISKYDQKVILEALHNCIAHQDYGRNGRVIVTEQQDKLIFENEGGFYDGQPEDYIAGEKTPLRYRNPFLAQAMAELNMIDTIGHGIHSMYTSQAKRYFPMPDYNLSEPNAVKMTIYGSVIDIAYSRLLIEMTNLPLDEILALDRIQKKLTVNDVYVRRLRSKGLIEGRKPNLYVSAKVAKTTATKADYIHTRAQDDNHYAKLITDYIK